jgi:hypothetical protein
MTDKPRSEHTTQNYVVAPAPTRRHGAIPAPTWSQASRTKRYTWSTGYVGLRAASVSGFKNRVCKVWNRKGALRRDLRVEAKAGVRTSASRKRRAINQYAHIGDEPQS